MGYTAVIGVGGIGGAVVRRLWGSGRPLVLGWHRDEGAALALLELGRQSGAASPLHLCQVDVTEPESCKAFFARAKKEAGPAAAVVNCAGVVDFSPALASTPAHVASALAVNLTGAINVCRAGTFPLMKAGGGAIVNVASVAAECAVPGLSAYAAAKAGVVAFTRTLALETAAYGVTANAVLPGFVDCGATAEMPGPWKAEIARHIPLRRLGTADEVAGLVALLTSDAGRYITGQSFVVDGGLSLGPSALAEGLRALASEGGSPPRQ